MQDYVRESNELANTWILVAFCFERWQAVSAPLSFRAKSKGSHARRAAFNLFLILFLSLVIKIPKFFEYEFVCTKDFCDGDGDDVDDGEFIDHNYDGHIGGVLGADNSAATAAASMI